MNRSKRWTALLGMTAGLALAGVATSQKADASTVSSPVYTTTQTTYVYRNINNPTTPIQTLASGTNWKIIRTAYDRFGNKWLDLGKNQWVKVSRARVIEQTAPRQTVQNTQTQTLAQTVPAQVHQAPRQRTSYTASANSGLASIAQAESGNSYSARNGQYIGKYQLSAAYLHGDYSPANQERVARQYAISRYGSISAAAAFHASHGWW